MNTKQVDRYIESKKLAWSASTLKSEFYRLKTVDWDHFKNPQKQYEILSQRLKPYALKTMFIRLTDFYEFLELGPNIYRKFMKDNARLFKNAYKKKQVDVDYKSTLEKISRISRAESRAKALFDLKAGLRVQADKIEGNEIVGKGGFRRPLLVAEADKAPLYPFSYSTYREDLKQVGLSAHDLRKVFANKLLRAGLSLTDIMAAGGWRSLQSVEKYLQELKTDELKDTVSAVMAG